MSDTLQYLIKHGYIVLFASVLAQQLGVPLPSASGLEDWLKRGYPVSTSAH